MGTKIVLAASDFQLTAVLRRVLVPVNIGKGGGCVVDPAGSRTTVDADIEDVKVYRPPLSAP